MLDACAGRISAVSSLRYHRKCQDEVESIQLEQVQSLINALRYTYQECHRLKCDTRTLGLSLKKHTLLAENLLTVIALTWDAELNARKDDKGANIRPWKQVLQMGELVDWKWRIAVSLESSHAKQLNNPVIYVEAVTLQPGQASTATHCFQMGLPEFREFSQTLQEISTMLSA